MSTRNQTQQKLQRKAARHARVRARVIGTASKPRLCVSRSNQHIQAQLIDDQKGVTIAVSRDDKAVKDAKPAEGLKGKSAAAYEVGMRIAKAAGEKKIKEVVFDRGGNRYHGRVKSLAEGARKGGLVF